MSDKKFGEPDKKKNTLSLDEEGLNAVTGGYGDNFNMDDIMNQVKKNIEKKKGNKK